MNLKNLVGGDIRALRKARGMTIKDLSSALGRSLGWLSQVERGQTTPSIPDLAEIAGLFGVNISFFFRAATQNPAERGVILRKGDRASLGSTASGLTEELLSPILSGSFEMIQSTFAPRSSSGGLKAARKTEDGGVLISGRLTLWIGELKVELEAGDSFQFAEQAYGWENTDDVPAVMIWVISPPVY